MFVRQVMTPDPVTVRAGTTVKAALRLLDDNDISSMPVVDGRGHIQGVVSEADLIRDLVGPDQRLREIPVEAPPSPEHAYVDEVMTAHAVTVRPDTDLADAVELVTSIGIKCLPVVDDDTRVIGVISRRDVVRMLARSDDLLEQDVDSMLVAAGYSHWLIDVCDGVAAVSGPESARERSLARVLVRAVPGIIAVNLI